MRVIVTGSRKFEDKGVVFDALTKIYQEHGRFTLIHGACATGADHWAEQWYHFFGHTLGVHRVRFPADWKLHGSAAGPMRNQRMVNDGADLVLAFPLPEGTGTQHTMKLAREAGIKVVEYEVEQA